MGVVASVSSTLSFGLINGTYLYSALSRTYLIGNDRRSHRHRLRVVNTIDIRDVCCAFYGRVDVFNAVSNGLTELCRRVTSLQNERRSLLFLGEVGTAKACSPGKLDHR